MTTYLVTGGCGFIGINLVRALTQRGEFVRILDNLSTGKKDDAKLPGIDLQIGDIRDLGAVTKACEGVDKVVHLAAHTRVVDSVENPQVNFEINAIGTVNVLRACRSASVKTRVLDSWPILEWIRGKQPGALFVEELLSEAEAGRARLHGAGNAGRRRRCPSSRRGPAGGGGGRGSGAQRRAPCRRATGATPGADTGEPVA